MYKKSITYLALLCASILTVGSCAKEMCENKQLPGSDTYVTEIIKDADSKVELEDGCTVWTEGDKLSVFRSSVNERYRFDGETGDVRGTISKDDSTVPGTAFSKSYAIYPYDAATTCTTEGTINYNFPSSQEYKENSYALGSNLMLASTTGVLDNRLNFHNVCGYIKLQIYGSKACILQSIRLYGNSGEKLSGPATVNTETYEVSMQTSATTDITLTFSEGIHLNTESTDFWIAIPPVTFANGFTIELTTDKGKSKTQSTAKEITIGRNCAIPMKAFTPNTYSTVERVFVLYGDSITPISVRNELQKLLDADSGETLGPDGFSVIKNKWKVVLAGVSGERPIQISARQGGVPVYLPGPITIPASGSVTVGSLYSTWSEQAVVNSKPVTAVKFSYSKESTTLTYTGCSNPFLVGGIECTYNGSTLTRVTAGEEVTVNGEDFSGEEWVRVYPYAAWKYRDAYFSTYQGTNGSYNRTPAQGGNTYEVLAKFYDAESEYSTSKKHIIVGYHNARWTQATTDYFASYYAGSAHVGEYFDMLQVSLDRAYEIADILNTPLTAQDSLDVKNGVYPTSWDRGDHIHMTTPLGYSAYGVCVYLKMKELGWLNYE